MLRSIGIRSKILAVLALPVLVLLLAASVLAGGAVNDARRSVQVERLAGQAPDLTQLVRGLQAERALTSALLAGDASARPTLDRVRTEVSEGITAVRNVTGAVDLSLLDPSVAEAVARSQIAHAQVDVLRRQVDGGALAASLATQDYTEIVSADIELAAGLGDAVEDRTLAAQLRAYTAVERVVESVLTERDVVTPAVAAGALSPGLREELSVLLSRHEFERAEATRQAEAVGVRVPAPAYTLQLARQRTASDADGGIDGLTVDQWHDAADADVAALGEAEGRLASAARSRASTLADEAFWRAWQVMGIALLAVIVPVVLALYLSRTITRPLRRLTEAAGEIRRELPAMVERMATPGEGPGVELPEIPVSSRDEIGRLAEAFNDVNSTTVQVAQEQVALRGSIAAMFVNVARRDQVLLSRQLAFIDQLERGEENPKTLENLFKLDHLATRMRRNAESLLVLAGIDAGRRLRRPMPLSDVVRTASSEIEHYERVDLVLGADPPMVGHVALTTAHLVAELLENATSFSDPDSRVVVTTDAGPRGVVVRIADRGLGMSPEELADANARIAEPAVTEVVGAQRLGFFVVGRLARRLDATVTLDAGPGRGTVAAIELPPALFAPGSVPEPPVPDDADDPAAAARATGPSRGGLFSSFRARRPGTADAADPAAGRPGVPEEPADVDSPAPEPSPEASIQQEPPAPEPASPPQQPPPPPTGAPALDILPARSSRRGGKGVRVGLPVRRPRDVPAADPAPVQPMTPAERSGLRDDATAAEQLPASPVVHPAPPDVAASGDDQEPAPVVSQPAPSTGPVHAPPGLFAVPKQSLTEPVPAPVPSSADREQRSALASEALTELSLLSSYRPSTVEGKPPATLTRRTPAGPPAAQVAPPAPTAATRRNRDASEIRSMLSGFQAGVARGRDAPQAPAPDEQNDPIPAPRPEDQT